MAYFPFFTDIADQKGLIVGGGRTALHKIEKLLPFSPKLTVIAPDILPEICALAEQSDSLDCKKRAFGKQDLENVFFVIAATDEPQVNEAVSVLCKERGIPVNAADDREHCSFLFPALIQKGSLTVGISTAGASPAAAGILRQRIDDAIPMHVDEILDYLERLRTKAKESYPNEAERAAFLKERALWCLEHDGIPKEEECGDKKRQNK